MAGRVGRHPDREAADGPRQFDQLDGVAQLPVDGAGSVGGSPPSAMRFSTPALRNSTRISASSSRVWATQMRWAIGVSVVVRSIPTTRSWVRWREDRPPR